MIQLNKEMKIVNTFRSASEAEKITKIWQSSITTTCRKRAKTAGGFKWMYKEDYEEYIKKGDIS